MGSWGWGGGPKKSIAIFAYKQRLLSIEMKTKLVQHVESDWMRDWKSVRVRKSESEREWEWESVRVSFEHRHENKSCSEHSNIHTFQVPSFCPTFRHFLALSVVFLGGFKQLHLLDYCIYVQKVKLPWIFGSRKMSGYLQTQKILPGNLCRK